MLIIKRMTAISDEFDYIDDRVLIGEDVLLRVTRTGFSLGYLPSSGSEWRRFQSTSDLTLLALDGSHSAVFAAYQDEVCIGCAAVRVSSSGWARLVDLRIDAAHRRMGAGTMLVDACQRFAQSHGMSGVSIATPDTNTVICQFCEKLGFQLGGVDRLALAMTESERRKPMLRRAGLLTFYRTNEKG